MKEPNPAPRGGDEPYHDHNGTTPCPGCDPRDFAAPRPTGSDERTAREIALRWEPNDPEARTQLEWQIRDAIASAREKRYKEEDQEAYDTGHSDGYEAGRRDGIECPKCRPLVEALKKLCDACDKLKREERGRHSPECEVCVAVELARAALRSAGEGE